MGLFRREYWSGLPYPKQLIHSKTWLSGTSVGFEEELKVCLSDVVFRCESRRPEPWGRALDESLHRKQAIADQLARASILGAGFPNGRGSQRTVGIFCQQGADRQMTGGHPWPQPRASLDRIVCRMRKVPSLCPSPTPAPTMARQVPFPNVFCAHWEVIWASVPLVPGGSPHPFS